MLDLTGLSKSILKSIGNLGTKLHFRCMSKILNFHEFLRVKGRGGERSFNLGLLLPPVYFFFVQFLSCAILSLRVKFRPFVCVPTGYLLSMQGGGGQNLLRMQRDERGEVAEGPAMH